LINKHLLRRRKIIQRRDPHAQSPPNNNKNKKKQNYPINHTNLQVTYIQNKLVAINKQYASMALPQGQTKSKKLKTNWLREHLPKYSKLGLKERELIRSLYLFVLTSKSIEFLSLQM
jgi:23S rRNA-/tRNA-specific pseudouridylate synthase